MSSYDSLYRYLFDGIEKVYDGYFMVEGGNASVGSSRAEKIDLDKFDRSFIKDTFQNVFKKLDELFFKKYKKRLWKNYIDVTNGNVFTGSSKYFFSDSISDDEYKKHKKLTGDIDIAVDRENITKLLELLNNYVGAKLVDNVVYVGSTKEQMKSEDGQINCIFRISDGVNTVNAQVDFEGARFNNGSPSEFAKFSHSSDWSDIKDGFKGVAHKFLLRALAKAVAPVQSFILVTPTSTYEKFKVSKSQVAADPAFLSFSVAKGLRNRFIPVKNDMGKQLSIDGKLAYKEDKDTSIEKYVSDISLMFKQLFKTTPKKGDIEKFSSFKGCIELVNKYHDQQTKEKIISHLVNGIMVQPLERDNPQGDMKIKFPLLGALIVKFNSSEGTQVAVKPSTEQKAETTLSSPPTPDKVNYTHFTFDGKEHIVRFGDKINKTFNLYYMTYDGTQEVPFE